MTHLSGKKLSVLVFFLDETFEEVTFDITTTVWRLRAAACGPAHRSTLPSLGRRPRIEARGAVAPHTFSLTCG